MPQIPVPLMATAATMMMGGASRKPEDDGRRRTGGWLSKTAPTLEKARFGLIIALPVPFYNLLFPVVQWKVCSLQFAVCKVLTMTPMPIRR